MSTQLALDLERKPPKTWGGWRPGAGRPRKPADQRGTMHRERAEVKKRFPVHVSIRFADGVRNLRKLPSLWVIESALEGARARCGLRVVHFSVQTNHLHMIVETDDKKTLRSAITSLNIRIAIGLNKLAGRKGQVIAHRYHARILKTPTQVRNAIVYVMNNHEHHSGRRGADPYSSAARPDLCVAPRTWLLVEGPKRV